jgi:hypothetical protein
MMVRMPRPIDQAVPIRFGSSTVMMRETSARLVGVEVRHRKPPDVPLHSAAARDQPLGPFGQKLGQGEGGDPARAVAPPNRTRARRHVTLTDDVVDQKLRRQEERAATRFWP